MPALKVSRPVAELSPTQPPTNKPFAYFIEYVKTSDMVAISGSWKKLESLIVEEPCGIL